MSTTRAAAAASTLQAKAKGRQQIPPCSDTDRQQQAGGTVLTTLSPRRSRQRHPGRCAPALLTAGARAWQRACCGCCALPHAPLPSARRRKRRGALRTSAAGRAVGRDAGRAGGVLSRVAAGAGLQQRVRSARTSPPSKEHGKGVSARRGKSAHPASKGTGGAPPRSVADTSEGPGAGGARLLSARWRQAAAASAPRKRSRPLLLAPAHVRAGHAAGCRARPCARWRTRDLPASARAQPLARCTLLCLCRGQAQGGSAAARQPATQQGPSAPAAPCAVRAAAQAELPAAGCFLWPTRACQGGRALPR